MADAEGGAVLSEETGTVLEQPTAAAIRDELQRLVIADLHGPLGGETEAYLGLTA